MDYKKNVLELSQIFADLDTKHRKTKIICTLGPACWDVDMLVKMLDAGMNVARLNFSHGDHKSHGAALDNLRAALKQRPDASCAVLLDTKGPEIRSGFLANHKSATLKAGQSLKIVTDYDFLGDETTIACSYPTLP